MNGEERLLSVKNKEESARRLADALGLGVSASPFPWQLRLLEQFVEGHIPRSLDLPTGLGKTATMAIWLLARAQGARLPRRLIYVVDRRAVVDQATEVASQLRAWVERDQDLAAALGLLNRPLPISTLRGQFVDNREWLEDPSLPAIVVGTVDMIGSRLLFEGYGTSRKMRPFHAALLGSDCLFVLDEAHLIPPFERLMERIVLDGTDLGPQTGGLLTPPPSRLLSLSATGRSKGGTTFDLDDADLAHSIVRKRLSAKKRLSLASLSPDTELAPTLAELAWALAENGPIRCVVFANKRDDAEQVAAELERRAAPARKGDSVVADVELLVGGRRIFERTEAAERLQTLGFLAGSDGSPVRPAFLVATSAGEVGIDLDADHMVCDLVSWERMVQRLGRVNRRGEGGAVVEVIVQPVRDKAEPEEIARHEAVQAVIEELPELSEGGRDLSPGALRDLQRVSQDDDRLGALIELASSPAPLHPVLERPTLDAWAMTSMRDHPGRPNIAPWLRGWIDDRPQTTLIWRTHLPERRDLAGFLEAAPPHASERLELETTRVADWLDRRVKAIQKKAEKTDAHLPRGIAAVTLDTSGDVVDAFTLQELAAATKTHLAGRTLPGMTLVLDARLAGLSPRGLLDSGEAEAPPTADTGPWLEAVDAEPPPVRFRVQITREASATDDHDWHERARFVMNRSEESEDVTDWLVIEKWRHDSATEEDRSAGRPQRLEEHLAWTGERAGLLAKRLGLSDAAKQVLATAARLHDEGKGASRWQDAFHAPDDGVYAKTRGPLNVRVLDGYRHEFGSLSMAEVDPGVRALDSEERDLVLHLIASHHGFARPIIRTDGGTEPPSVLTDRAQAVALRFARLQRHWGPWGLAWWEALLRAADQQASRDNDARGPDGARAKEAS